MATLKYKVKSPYQTKAAPPPLEDKQYYTYLEHLNLDHKTGQNVFGIALFGVGRAGTIHLSHLIQSRRVKLLYIVDDDKSKLDNLRKYWNLSGVTCITNADSERIFKDTTVKAIVVCSPTFTHEEIIKKGLNSNKAVFCEKPIAESFEKSKALYELAKKVNQPLLSAFNRRFDPAYSSIKTRVRQGEIGMVLTVKVCSRDSPLPSLEYLRISGGIFHDCAVHDIDMILFVLGEYPSKVSVMARANIPEIAGIDDYDTVAIILSFDSGALGIIDLSRHCTFGYDQRLEVFGQKGMLKAENRQPVANVELYTHENVLKAPIDYSFPSRYKEGYIKEMEHFLDVMEGKCELLVDGKDNLAVTKIATACEESARTGKVVELKWSKEELPSTQVSTA